MAAKTPGFDSNFCLPRTLEQTSHRAARLRAPQVFTSVFTHSSCGFPASRCCRDVPWARALTPTFYVYLISSSTGTRTQGTYHATTDEN